MKAILLYANDDAALESRLQAAIELTRAFEGHLTCLHVTPYDAFIVGDPFGGFYASPRVVEQLGKDEEAHRARVEARLEQAGISWEWLNYNGQAASVLVAYSRLADLVIVSMSVASDGLDGPLSLAADVALHARSSIFAVPCGTAKIDCLEIAVVAWNGSAEAGQALRLALPILRQAKSVHIVSVKEENIKFSAAAAGGYLELHGVPSVLQERCFDGSDVSEIILDAARDVGGNFIVMGAYGHSRIREAVLGGVTRSMLKSSEIPLVFAH